MSKLKIRTYPDPILGRKSVEVTEFNEDLCTLLDDLAVTMHENHGIGLAAIQVGIPKRMTVVDVSANGNERIDLVNPKILSASGSCSGEEGCLSVPGFWEVVKRSKEIVIEAQDRFGKEFELKADGVLARCIQHEIDHMDGILFVNRLSRLKREFFRRWLKKKEPPAPD